MELSPLKRIWNSLTVPCSSSGVLTLCLLSLCLTSSAYAEKNRTKKEPITILAEDSKLDGKKNITTFNGNVVLTSGSLIVKSDRAIVTENPDGFNTVVLFGTPARQAFFRQKREGGNDLWLEGQSDKIEYDEKSDIVKFISKAKIKYLEGTKVTQEQDGEYLSYDSINDVFVASNNTSGVTQPGAGRVKLILQPKNEKTAN